MIVVQTSGVMERLIECMGAMSALDCVYTHVNHHSNICLGIGRGVSDKY